MNRLLLFIIISCCASYLKAQTTIVSSSPINLIENQNITLKMGETCTITLDEKNTGQFAWTFSFSQNTILYKKSESFHNEKRTFVFATTNEGNITIKMILMNRQTGFISNTPPKIYYVSVISQKGSPTMAASKPAAINRPVPSGQSPYVSTIAPNNGLQAKSEAPTNEGYYPTPKTTTTSPTKAGSQASLSTYQTNQKVAAAPKPTTSVAVSSFHTDIYPLSLFKKNVVKENQVFGIDIEENIPTGKWTYVLDKSAIQLVDEEVFDKSNGLGTNNKLHSYKFKATQPGEYDIMFHVFSTENKSINKHITYTVEVK